MDEDGSIGKILGGVTNIGSVIGLFSQLFIWDFLSDLLGFAKTDVVYSSIIIGSLILSLIVILGMYAYKYKLLLIRFYPNKQKHAAFVKYTRKSNLKIAESNNEVMLEPFFIDLPKLVIIIFILAIVFLFFAIRPTVPLVQGFSYMFFVILAISSLTLISINLIETSLYEKGEEKKYSQIFSKIDKYFAPKYEIIRQEEISQGSFHVCRITLKLENKIFYVSVDKNNLNRYFEVSEYVNDRNKKNADPSI